MITAKEARDLYEQESEKRHQEDIRVAQQWVDDIVEPLVREAVQKGRISTALSVQGCSENLVEKYLLKLGYDVQKNNSGKIARISW